MIKGLSAMKEAMGKSMEYIKLKSGESKVLRIAVPADELIGVWEHTEQFGGQWRTVTCLGKNECPLCQAGKRASFKAYIPVIDRADDKVKIFKASKETVKLILGLVEEYGDITARDFKVVRQGEKLDTTYQFFARDPKDEDFSGYEIPNIEERVEPMTREAILALMEGGATAANAGANPVGGEGDDDYPF
jgi:hypothetical protein